MIKILKNIIIIENDNQIQCDTLEEVVKLLIDKEYYNLDTNQRIDKMRMKALKNCIANKMQILENLQINDIKDLDGKFIIKDEITYILSLLMANKIIILEKVDANIFATNIDKYKMKNNYIVINKLARKLLYDRIIGLN